MGLKTSLLRCNADSSLFISAHLFRPAEIIRFAPKNIFSPLFISPRNIICFVPIYVDPRKRSFRPEKVRFVPKVIRFVPKIFVWPQKCSFRPENESFRPENVSFRPKIIRFVPKRVVSPPGNIFVRNIRRFPKKSFYPINESFVPKYFFHK